MKNKIISILLSATLVSLSIFTVPAKYTYASENLVQSSEEVSSEILSQDELQNLISWFEIYGVPSETQTKLINKIDNGELWVSLSGVEPIKSEEVNDVVEPYTKQTFPDGSILITSLGEEPKLENDIRERASFSGGKVVSSSTYHSYVKEKRIYASAGVAEAYFYFDYILNKGENNDEIVDAYWGSANCVGGTVAWQGFDRDITSDKETAYKYATVSYRFQMDWYSGAASSTGRLTVKVGNNTIKGSEEF